MNSFEDLFKNPDEPSLTNNRYLAHSHVNAYTLIFKRCNHSVVISMPVLDGMKTSYEQHEYLNALVCRQCEVEFDDMATKLKNAHLAFEKYGHMI